MRGEIQEEVIVVEGSGDGYSSARVMTKQISEKDRLKAAELLAKRYGILTDKVKLDVTPIVIRGDDQLED